MNVLLVNPGRREYLVKYFQNLKKKNKFSLYLIDADQYSSAFAVPQKKFNFVCPRASDKKNFIKFIKTFISRYKINVVFPLSEYELEVLAELKDFFIKKNVNIIISNLDVVKLCNNKLKCYNFFRLKGIKSPKIIDKKFLNKHLPVIKKEVYGNGSKNQIIIRQKIHSKINNDKNFFYQKYFQCTEIGIDILNDLKGRYVHSCIKKKISMRSGDTDKAQIIFSKKFTTFAKKISKYLNHIGIIDVDCLYYKNEIFLLDINPRIGGGYPFTHEYGFDYLQEIFKNLKNSNYKPVFKNKKNKKTFFSKGISIISHFKK